MTLADVLPQVGQLGRDDLIELHRAVRQLLAAHDQVVDEETTKVVNQRYQDYLDHPETSIGPDEMADFLDELIL